MCLTLGKPLSFLCLTSPDRGVVGHEINDTEMMLDSGHSALAIVVLLLWLALPYSLPHYMV